MQQTICRNMYEKLLFTNSHRRCTSSIGNVQKKLVRKARLNILTHTYSNNRQRLSSIKGVKPKSKL